MMSSIALRSANDGCSISSSAACGCSTDRAYRAPVYDEKKEEHKNPISM